MHAEYPAAKIGRSSVAQNVGSHDAYEEDAHDSRNFREVYDEQNKRIVSALADLCELTCAIREKLLGTNDARLDIGPPASERSEPSSYAGVLIIAADRNENYWKQLTVMRDMLNDLHNRI